MKTRAYDYLDEAGVIGTRPARMAPPPQGPVLDLFAPPPVPARDPRPAGTEDQQRQIARLVPIAQRLAASAGPRGIIVGELRLEAVRLKILTGHEQGRTLSYLHSVPRAAGLAPTEDYRRSPVDQSHGNLQKVYVAKEYAS